MFTSMFLHVNLIHLAGNMIYLWIFGNNIEDKLGRFWFIGFYLLGGVAAVVTQVLIDPTSEVPMIGASGAISAVLGAYLVLFPGARILSLVFLGFFYQLHRGPGGVRPRLLVRCSSSSTGSRRSASPAPRAASRSSPTSAASWPAPRSGCSCGARSPDAAG